MRKRKFQLEDAYGTLLTIGILYDEGNVRLSSQG